MNAFTHEMRKSMTPARIARIHEKCGGRCGVCGFPLGFKKYEIDHIIPLSSGGSDSDDNLQCICIPCHATKTGADISRASHIKRIAIKHKVPSKFRRSRAWR